MSRAVKYIGMDVHKEAVVIAVLNHSGPLGMESIVETKASSRRERIGTVIVPSLEQAIARRRPRPGWVHHSDRGLQYARSEYGAVLEKFGMVPSMSRPANPYDNASCESFMKTLQREETYANRYENLEHLRSNIEEFIEQYYNRRRLHSALVSWLV